MRPLATAAARWLQPHPVLNRSPQFVYTADVVATRFGVGATGSR